MNNSPGRYILGAIAVLVFLMLFFNHRLNKELTETMKKSASPATIPEEPKKFSRQEYKIQNDDSPYSSPETAEVLTTQEKTKENITPQRVRDEKIIYEMPTIDRFLLQ